MSHCCAEKVLRQEVRPRVGVGHVVVVAVDLKEGVDCEPDLAFDSGLQRQHSHKLLVNEQPQRLRQVGGLQQLQLQRLQTTLQAEFEHLFCVDGPCRLQRRDGHRHERRTEPRKGPCACELLREEDDQLLQQEVPGHEASQRVQGRAQ